MSKGCTPNLDYMIENTEILVHLYMRNNKEIERQSKLRVIFISILVKEIYFNKSYIAIISYPLFNFVFKPFFDRNSNRNATIRKRFEL